MVKITLKKLKWLSILAPALFLGAFEFARHEFFHAANSLWVNIATIFLVGGAAYFFSHFIFNRIGQLQKSIEESNRELSAINKIALAIGRSLNLDEILSNAAGEIHKAFPDTEISLYISHANKLHLVERKGLLNEASMDIIELSKNPQEKEREGFIKAVRGGSLAVEEVRPGQYWAYLPFKAKKEVVGVLLMARKSSFLSGEVEVLNTIGHQLGYSIENARLHSRLYELAIIEERERIAREIHDGLAQILGYVTLKASISRRLLSSGDVPQAEGEIKEIERVSQEAYTDAREAISGLRTYISKDGGIKRTLNEYINKFSLTSGVRVELDIQEGLELNFLPDEEIQLIRIIQEALTNVRKHAKAGKAWIRFQTRDNLIKLVVEDNGKGFDVSSLAQGNEARYGLQTMKERAEKIGGSFKIISYPGLRTKVEILLLLTSEMAKVIGAHKGIAG